MRQCPHCNHENREGMLFCEDCGRPIPDAAATAVDTLRTRVIDHPLEDIVARETWGTASFDRDAEIVLRIADGTKPLSIKPNQRLILGRVDKASSQIPDIDLTPFHAEEKGVSRIHAAIYRTEGTLTLVDMGSSNGTHLNGQKLMARQPRVLRDGDEIRLGKMIIHIYFKT